MKGVRYVAIAPGVASDPRIVAIAAALHKNRRWIAGCLPAFFGEVAANASDGNLSEIPDRLLDVWAGNVRGFGTEVRQKLCDSDGVLRSWFEYNGRALTKRELTRKRVIAHRLRKSGEKENTASGNAKPSVTVTLLPNLTLPRSFKNNNKRLNNLDASADADARLFTDLWAAYPHREGSNPRKAAFTVYRAKRAHGVLHETIAAGVAAYAQQCRAQQTEPRFIAQCVTFLRQDRFLDDYTPVAQEAIWPCVDDQGVPCAEGTNPNPEFTKMQLAVEEKLRRQGRRR